MNILMFTKCMGSGGTEKVIYQLCEMLKNHGHTVIVCSANGEGVKKLRQMGIQYIEIPDIQTKSPFIILSIMRKLVATIKSERIEIVHTHHRMAAFLVALIRYRFNFKFINTIHNTFNDKKKMTKFAFSRAENVAVGESVRENMLSVIGLDKNKIRVIYNAIDNSHTRQEELPLIRELREHGCFLVGNVGRINTQKGFAYYINAAEIIKNKGLPIKFLIVGDGVLWSEMEEMVAEKNLQDTVFFLGFSNNVLNVIQKLDLVVLSSLWEGFPLTPIETFSMGKTIVATAVPGTVEIVKDHENGIIVPLKDSAAIANAVILLYENPTLRGKLEAAAKATYAAKFSYPSFCENYLHVYELQGKKIEKDM